MSSKVIASFSAFGNDLSSIVLIVFHSLEGSVVWSSVSTNCLHVFLRCSFVVLVISAFICCRAGEVVSLDLRSSHDLMISNISTGTGSVLIWCRPEGICHDATFRRMVRKIFSPFWQFVGSRPLLSLSSISLRYRSQFAFFKLKRVRWGMGLIVRSICKLMRIGRWSELRFVFVCQLVEVIREVDANETSGEDGLALAGSLVGKSQLRIQKLEPDIIVSNRVNLVSVELEYHAEWYALKSPSIRVSIIIIRWSREGR